MKNWANELEQTIKRVAGGDQELESFVRANVASVKQWLRGIGPDDVDPGDGAGACIVFNMSCKHIPGFCEESASGNTKPYKNAYDLHKASRKREFVDEALARVYSSRGVTIEKENLYFAAVETTGTGIRFFGDMCLVLRFRPYWHLQGDIVYPSSDEQLTLVLERNSYDLVRAPIAASIAEASKAGVKSAEDTRDKFASDWAGSWANDLLDMVALRILQDLPITRRRWTGGEIARVLLDDEDYCEVLFPRSFAVNELVEIRVSAADAAAEGDIADRERTGEAPGAHELEWRQQRRDARRALARAKVPVRVVTTSGRLRG